MNAFVLVRVLVVGLFGIAAPMGSAAENLVANPSAEDVAVNGRPEGWGLYAGAGQMKLTSTLDERYSGQRAACLELIDWYTPKDAPDAAAQRSVSGALILAPSNGYNAQGAIECIPATRYAFSFWYKGDVSSVAINVTGWPSPDADHPQRVQHTVSGGSLRPSSQWQRCTGAFRIQEGVTRMVLMIQVTGKQSDGCTLGKLYVDDAQIIPKHFPDGELRAVWCGLPKAKEREAGLREIGETVRRVKQAGLNTLFIWTETLYLAALDQVELQQAEPRAAWDALGEMMRAARQHGLQVHAWYSPWIYKSPSRAVELKEHPDWAAVNAQGVADNDGICFVRPEVRQFQLDLLGRFLDRYPDLAGLHIEEPGFNWGADYCYCDHCQQLCRHWFGVDIRRDAAAKPVVHNLAAFMGSDFFARLRQLMIDKRPELWLSANGSGGDNPDWYIGRDWTTWAQRGYLDFYVPQVYTKDVDAFTQRGLKTKARLGACDLATGLAVSWSSIYPERQAADAIKAEIGAARLLGAKGFVLFHLDHFYDEHWQAVQEATEGTARP
ncbi:MAG: family 10 glycosylhydrolase [Candidatus Anammoximicrobium sp.]|nr:family 10 glycosylhydrolase [Candidatus Anammoximicrobium sp.]